MQNWKLLCHLARMDDMKLLSTTKDGLNIVLKTIQKFSVDIRMEFGLDICQDQLNEKWLMGKSLWVCP